MPENMTAAAAKKMKTERHRLAIETGASVATVRRWYEDPLSVGATSQYALARAAKTLGIDPPAPKEAADAAS